MGKQPGWVYVGDGWLRYRDTEGWTEHYLEAEAVRGLDWPPVAPVEVRSKEAVVQTDPASMRADGHDDRASRTDGPQDTAAHRVRAVRVRRLLRSREGSSGRHRAGA